MGTQALQVIENIRYLLDCHAGGHGFESRPLRRPLRVRTNHLGVGLPCMHRYSQGRAGCTLGARLEHFGTHENVDTVLTVESLSLLDSNRVFMERSQLLECRR